MSYVNHTFTLLFTHARPCPTLLPHAHASRISPYFTYPMAVRESAGSLNTEFGTNLAISGDGNVLAVSGGVSGGLYVYEKGGKRQKFSSVQVIIATKGAGMTLHELQGIIGRLYATTSHRVVQVQYVRHNGYRYDGYGKRATMHTWVRFHGPMSDYIGCGGTAGTYSPHAHWCR